MKEINFASAIKNKPNYINDQMKKSKIYLLGILALLCLMPNVALAQNLTVEGVVLDETGEPLIGVSVIIVGSGSGAITDFDGYGNTQQHILA